jgi:hypothetical protein
MAHRWTELGLCVVHEACMAHRWSELGLAWCMSGQSRAFPRCMSVSNTRSACHIHSAQEARSRLSHGA